jgi:hypothetical protein
MQLPKLHYPKLNLLLISFVITFLLAREGTFAFLTEHLNGHGYISVFLAGLLFSFGFTTAAGIVIFAKVAPDVHLLPAALLGGLGAMVMDQVLLRFVEFSFEDEFDRLRESAFARRIHDLFHHQRISEQVRRYILWSSAGLLIASPLPDELGITVLSSVRKIEHMKFAIMCFALNTVGIFFVLLAAKAIS